MAHTTVAAARRRSPGGSSGPTVGRDGRARHGDPRAARRRAAHLLTERPEATLREIARLAGLSPTTVLDVRRTMAGKGSAGAHTVGRPALDCDPAAVLATLRRDPSLRYSTAGRTLVRLLSLTLGGSDPADLASAVPPHSRATLAELARLTAEQWLRTATALETMNRKDGLRRS